MSADIFDQVVKDADNKELQVRLAAIVASSAATCLAERIEAASSGASPIFRDLMQPYLQRFKFYEGLQHELDRRCRERQQTSPYATNVNIAIPNGKLFKAIGGSLEESRSIVDASPLTARKIHPKGSRSDKLHPALHMLELAAAMNHGTHPAGHVIGPVVGLVLGALEARGHKDVQDAFADVADFLGHLDEIDRQLRKIAVGVYRVPAFWPTMNNLDLQRKLRGAPDAKHLDADSPLPEEEAERAMAEALHRHNITNAPHGEP